MRLGGVPTSVIMPPKIVPKAKGINTSPGGNSNRLASCIATGIRSAIAPTLFINPESAAPRPSNAIILTNRPA